MPRTTICPQPGFTGMVDLSPSRCAVKRVGGVGKTIYIGSLSELEGITQDADGQILTITMKTGKKLYTLTGKKLKNSHSTELQQSENATLFGQSVNFVAYFDTQAEKNAIELLCKLEDAFIIVENKYGRMEAFGLVGVDGMEAEGLSVTAGTYAVEAGMDGGSNMPLTFSGSEARLPVYTSLGDDLPEEIAYLEALKVPAV